MNKKVGIKQKEGGDKMKGFLRLLVPILLTVTLAFGVVLANPEPVAAATTADVTITWTPDYLAFTISNSPNTWAIGAVAATTVYWWTAAGTAPAPEPFEADDMKETITNTGSIAEDFDIKTTAATGGVGQAISADDTPAGDEFSLRAGITGTTDAASMIQVIVTDTEIISNLAAAGTMKVCLRFKMGVPSDGVAKSATATYTCRAVT